MTTPQDTAPASTRRLRIGLIVDCLRESYEGALWAAVVEEARLLDVDLICFAGGLIPPPNRRGSINFAVLHDLIGRENVDGIVSLIGSIGNQVTPEEVIEHHRARFSDIPLIGIGSHLPDVPSIVAENASGMYSLISHFIEHHGAKRIAFITGPEGSHDARQRLDAYRRALTDHDLKFDEQLVAPGDFNAQSGGAAALELIKNRRVSFDALVAANDYMVIDAMRVLEQFNLAVPDDVLVGGFDDVPEAGQMLPSLTTVGQPVAELGREGIRRMVAWLRIGAVPAPLTTVDTHIILRASCGCRGATRQSSVHQHISPLRSLAEIRTALADDLERRFPAVSLSLPNEGWATELIDAYVAELEGRPASLMPRLKRLIVTAEERGMDVVTWAQLLGVMFVNLRPYLPDATAVNHAAQLFLTEYAEARKEEHDSYIRERNIQLMFRFQRPLAATFDIRVFSKAFRETMPRLGINTFYFSLYDDTKRKATGPSRAILLFDYNPTTRQVESALRDDETPLFSSRELIPGGLRESTDTPHSLTVFPVFLEKEEDLGFVVFDNQNTNPMIYEVLADQLATLTKGSRLLEEARGQALKLEQDVIARTKELRAANDALLQTNRQIQKLNEELDRKSKIDTLTHLYNRGAFFEVLRQELNRTRRTIQREKPDAKGVAGETPKTFSIMMVDVDHFKHVNDTYGHIAGDRVLVRIGELMKDANILRMEDLAGRFGGEEFIVILANTGIEGAMLPATRLAQRLKQEIFTGDKFEQFSVTLSIGISEYSESDGNEELVIQRADEALYYAKNHGRDQIVVYEKLDHHNLLALRAKRDGR
jgi:diguanylate cyclase (GGDEF)-like protein